MLGTPWQSKQDMMIKAVRVIKSTKRRVKSHITKRPMDRPEPYSGSL
jgi:hypothetical protein